MRGRFSMATALAAFAVTAAVSGLATPASAPPASPKTPWGDPDLQGIWTDEFDTPFQRPPKYANQELFTEAQRDAINKERTELYSEERPAERGTDLDVARAYNHAVFLSNKRVGARTSLIGDQPPSGETRLPPTAEKIA